MPASTNGATPRHFVTRSAPVASTSESAKSRPEPDAPTSTPPRAPLHQRSMMARKSQQQVPTGQLFNTLDTATLEDMTADPMTPTPGSARPDSVRDRGRRRDSSGISSTNEASFGHEKRQTGAEITPTSKRTFGQIQDQLKASRTPKTPNDKALRRDFIMGDLAATSSTSSSKKGKQRSTSRSRVPRLGTILTQLIEQGIIRDTIERPYLFIARRYLPLKVGVTVSDLKTRLQGYNGASIRCDESGWYIIFENSKQGKDEAVRCYQECHLQKIRNFVMNMELNQRGEDTATDNSYPTLHLEQQAVFTEHTTRPTPTNTTAPSVNGPATVTPPPEEQVAEQLASDGIDAYRALIHKRDNLETQAEHKKAEAEKIKRDYNDRRAKKRHSIDVEMLACHKEERARGREKSQHHEDEIKRHQDEIQRHQNEINRHKDEVRAFWDKLKEKHKAEEATGKGEYQALKAEALAYQEEAEKQLKALEQQIKAVLEEIGKQRNNLSRDELLAFVERGTPNKRRKLDNKTTQMG